jgi:hypothetical protein
MNEDILIKCDICGELFNPGILKEAYPWGFIVICNKCIKNRYEL